MRKRPVFKSTQVHSKLSDMVFPTPSRAVNVGSRNHKKELLKLYCGYDTETTTTRTFDGWKAAVYSHQLSIANDKECHVLLLRTWQDFMDALEQIKDNYGITEDRRIIFWVANLSFEFSFLAFRYEWSDFFAKEERQPLLATCLDGIEFRECLTISGGNLEYLAKTYCYTKKLVGDLDYSIMRNTSTVLTTEERNYIINDVVILSEFSYYMFKTHIIPKRKVPMTKTGILLDEVKSEYKTMSKKLDNDGSHKKAYELFINKAFPDKSHYDILFKYVFRGGYVHANAYYADSDLQAVDMYDITSSYPYEMLTSYVPISPFEKTDYDEKHLKEKCCILFASFKNIKSTTYHSIESKNKIIECDGAKYDNGRLISAGFLRVALTELDFANYKDFYSWDEMKVESFYIAERGKMPLFLRNVLVKHYATKNRLKREEKEDTIEYKLAKESVNSLYGGCVKRIRLDKVEFQNGIGWTTKKNEKPFEKEIENKILLPQWGVWVTASARRSLLSMVKKLDSQGVQVVYCDTDSIKYIDNSKGAKIIKNVNARREKRLLNRGYKQKDLQGIGLFDREKDCLHGCVRFKTCGAKRYVYATNDEKTKITVAGMPKQTLSGYSVNELFDMFTMYGFVVKAENSLKLTTAYTDSEYKIYIDGEWMEEKSGVALYDIPFTMRLDTVYQKLINDLKELARVDNVL